MTAWLDFVKSQSKEGESLSKRLKRASKIWRKMKPKKGKTGKHRGGAVAPLAVTGGEVELLPPTGGEVAVTGGEVELLPPTGGAVEPLPKVVGGKTTKRSKHSNKSKKFRK